jgi:O-antigen/teichoic acid export membrane protein
MKSSMMAHARRVASMIRLRPFETQTEEGRSRERYRRIALSMGSSALAKGIATVAMFVAVPLSIKYLGPERFGLWMTISSTIAMLGFGDFGIGLGLLNAVADADGRQDREEARRCVSSGFYLLLSVGVALGAAFVLAGPFVNWGRLFNVSSAQAASESGGAVAAFAACFLVNIPLWVVIRVQMGYQEGYVNSLWEAVGNSLGLAALLIAIRYSAGLPWLILGMSGAPLLATLANGAVLFKVKRPWLIPDWRAVSAEPAKRILGMGTLFFLSQILGALAYSSDNLVAARILGPEAVARYAVPMKLFGFIPLVVGMVLIPLWPAYGEAIARGDTAWVRATLRRSIGVSFLFSTAACLPLVLFGGGIIRWWVGPSLEPEPAMLLGMGLWTVLSCSWGAAVMFLNGAGAIRVQTLWTFVMAVGAVTAKIFLAKEWGLPGIIWGTFLAQFFFLVVPLTFYADRLLKSMGAEARRIPGGSVA